MALTHRAEAFVGGVVETVLGEAAGAAVTVTLHAVEEVLERVGVGQ